MAGGSRRFVGEAARGSGTRFGRTGVAGERPVVVGTRIDEARCCPHCASAGRHPRPFERAQALWLRRLRQDFQCFYRRALNDRFGARLRKTELCAAFTAGLSDGDTAKGAAGRCGVADTTSFRWRHRFLAAVQAGAVKLKGIVEADEADVHTRCTGAPKLDRSTQP
jgi:hypothetical protein